eukprot:808795_1
MVLDVIGVYRVLGIDLCITGIQSSIQIHIHQHIIGDHHRHCVLCLHLWCRASNPGWFFLIKFPLIPGALLVVMLARSSSVSRDENIHPYLESFHIWLRWITQKIFCRRCLPTFFAWFCYFVLCANIAAAVVDEYKLNHYFIYNAIIGTILCVTLQLPYVTGKNTGSVGKEGNHDMLWPLDYGWITLYTVWHATYIAFKYSGSLWCHVAILIPYRCICSCLSILEKRFVGAVSTYYLICGRVMENASYIPV